MLSGNKRILVNTIGMFMCSIVSVCLTLFSSRWALEELGVIDFGLYNLITSVLLVFVFLNTVIANGDARFLSISLGSGDLLEMNKLFNTILLLHIVVPIVIVIIGVFVGEYLIQHFLVVPVERMDVIIWGFRITLVASLVAMMAVPFVSLFLSHQNIAEYTLIMLLQAVLIFMSAYSLRFVEGDKFLVYCIFMSLSDTFAYIAVSLLALKKYSDIKISICEFFNKQYSISIIKYSFWNMLGDLGHLVRSQGIVLVTNLYFGPSGNAALGIANQLGMRASKLTNSLSSATNPELYRRIGKKDVEGAQSLSNNLTRLGIVTMMVIAVPVLFHLNYILELWLVNVPEGTEILCTSFIIMFILEKVAMGQLSYLTAINKISLVESCIFLSYALAVLLPFMGLLKLGYLGIGLSIIISMVLSRIIIIYFSHKYYHYSYYYYLKTIIGPLLVEILIFFLLYYLYQPFHIKGIWMLLFSCSVLVVVVAVVSLFISFNSGEREYIFKMVLAKFQKVK